LRARAVTAPDIRQLDRRAVLASVEVVSRVTGDDLGRPTPCSGWTLADLLAHLTVQHDGFAAAATGRGAEPAVWQAAPRSADPVADYTAAADRVIAAFAPAGVLQQPFSLPEITTKTTFPGSVAIGFHFLDYVVHSWDVARSLGIPLELPADLLDAALPIAEAVPDGARRQVPGAAFQPRLPAPTQAGTLDRIVALLGRSPSWPD
jgi:uncharacterized protein (TIGR03086 family)